MCVDDIAVCIATYNNDNGLLKCLSSVLKCIIPKGYKLTINIVDNHRQDVTELRNIIESHLILKDSILINLDIEVNKGIPFVRNRLVKMSALSKYIVFIDDDEYVSVHWLLELFASSWKGYDIVTGPVIPIVNSSVSKFKRRRYFFSSNYDKQYSMDVDRFYTGNVLIKTDVLLKINGPFDESMADTGGTDSLLSSSLVNLGYKIRYNVDAVVYEDVPESRLWVSWFLSRRFRNGYVAALMSRKSNKLIFKQCLAHLVSLLCKLLNFSELRFGKGPILALGHMFFILGAVSFTIGMRYNEYNPKQYRT